MAKTTNPLLGLEAHGTIADTLTFQRRSKTNFVRKKPTPTDPYSLAQAYHRWLYQDYSQYWHTLTPAQKQQWESDARRQRITGYNLWLRTYLTTLPDIAGWWKLDPTTSPTQPDSSLNANHATVFGATPARGLINGALSFDGVDDYLDSGLCANLDTQTFHVSAYVYPRDITVNGSIIGQYAWGAGKGGWTLNQMSNRYRLGIFNSMVETIAYSPVIPAPNRWYYVHATYDKTSLKVYLQNVRGTPVPLHVDLLPSDNPLLIGARSDDPAVYNFDGIIDNPLLLTRILTASDSLRHSQRRYPL